MTYMPSSEVSTEIAEYTAWASSATRDLELLRAIDQTVTALCTVHDLMDSIHRSSAKLLERLPNATKAIPEGEIVPGLEALLDDIATAHRHFVEKKASADCAEELDPEDGVSDAYEQALSSMSDAHAALDDLRWGILNHNALLEPASGQAMSDPSEIEKFLLSL